MIFSNIFLIAKSKMSFRLHVVIGNKYRNFEDKSLINQLTIDNFINYLTFQSEFRYYRNCILQNFNYVSYVYLYRSDSESYDRILTGKEVSYLYEKYPDVIRELNEDGKVIISYALIHDSNKLNNNYEALEFIESRVKGLKIGKYLLTRYLSSTNKDLLPACIKPEKSSVFWFNYNQEIRNLVTSYNPEKSKEKFINYLDKYLNQNVFINDSENQEQELETRIKSNIKSIFDYWIFEKEILMEIKLISINYDCQMSCQITKLIQYAFINNPSIICDRKLKFELIEKLHQYI